jgi:hypothetical protein
MMAQQRQYRFKMALDRTEWSPWLDLDEGHTFEDDIDYRFRDKPVKPLQDGIYLRLNSPGVRPWLAGARGPVLLKLAGCWYELTDGSNKWANISDEAHISMNDDEVRRLDYIRFEVAK